MDSSMFWIEPPASSSQPTHTAELHGATVKIALAARSQLKRARRLRRDAPCAREHWEPRTGCHQVSTHKLASSMSVHESNATSLALRHSPMKRAMPITAVRIFRLTRRNRIGEPCARLTRGTDW